MFSLVTSGIAGYITAVLCSGKDAGESGKVPSLKFRVNDYVVHLHHWLCSGFILAVFPVTMRDHISLSFFLIGVLVQGLTYPDFYRIVYRHSV